MSDTLSFNPAASYGAGNPYSFDLDPQSGNGFAADSAARFQDALANAARADDSGNGASGPAVPASAGSAPTEAASAAPAPDASSATPQQAGDGKPASSVLGNAWDWTKQQASAAGQAVGSFDAAHGHVLTRAAGAAQAVGAVAEGLTGAAVAGVGGAATATGVGAAPGVPAMIGGGALMANALDNGVAGVRTAWTGEFHHTLTSQAAGAGARALGASDQTAERITTGVDLAQGVAGGGASIAAGIARKGAVEGTERAVRADNAVAHVAEGATGTEKAAQTGSTAAHGTEAARFGRNEAEYESLAKDPAHSGKVSVKSEQEPKVGLELEERGGVPAKLIRDPTGAAEFVDGAGQKWDVKGFNSDFKPSKGGFDLQVDANKVDKSLKAGENVMLDTSKMTQGDVTALKAEGTARSWGKRVVYWP